MNKEFTSGYAPVNGLNIYYEIHSVADERKTPLVLLHGGGDTIQTSFRYVLPALARDRQIPEPAVIARELRIDDRSALHFDERGDLVTISADRVRVAAITADIRARWP